MPEVTAKAILLELNALRDENDSLREEIKEHKNFIAKISSMLPPSYDIDESMEAIIIHFLEDMQTLAQVVAKLTANFR